MRVAVVLCLLLIAAPVAAQEPPGEENPLAELKADLTRVLADANLPFATEQDRAITLMMEDRLNASETLFGGLMDFRGGPTSGQEAERLQSAIGWLRTEFLSHVDDYLTPEQQTVWTGYRSTATASPTTGSIETPRAQPPQQTQYVRINNNRFTAEDDQFRGGQGTSQGNFNQNFNPNFNNFDRDRGNQGTEVIERGGAGAWHGTTQGLFKDDALNARNVFAANKPPYQERQINVDVGGPAIPGRLSTSLVMLYSLAQNVDTINATLPDGPFALGITRPTTNRSLETRNTLQLADAHSIGFNARYFTDDHRDEGIGGFTLRDRASHRNGANWNAQIRQFSALGTGSLFESRFIVFGNRTKIVPFSEAIRVDVSDTFNSGGAQNRYQDNNRTYEFGNLYTRLGPKLTLKTGIDGYYRRNESFSLQNFGGTFTFPNLDAFINGVADTYRIARGNPSQETTQFEFSGFVQNDYAITRQLTLMAGLRYDNQTNLDDRNNVSPRASLAYGAGRGLVFRGGWGMYYERMGVNRVAEQRRFDGIQQYEIVIDKPLYPDPFSGALRNTFPSIRVTDPTLHTPANFVMMTSVEKTFRRTMLVTAMYDYQTVDDRFVMRDLNQPLDIRRAAPAACTPGTPADSCLRPDRTQGSVLNLTNQSFERTHTVRLSVRDRFSIFNMTGNYVYQNRFEDNCGYCLPTNTLDPRADWSTGNQPHHGFNASLNARVPFGIFLTQTVAGNTARYYTITTGNDDNQDGTKNDRPAGVGRNSVLGPGRLNFDLNIS
ncbi:MAG TPA: TonB-dependent receptor, partial [Vicinamibacterales bacterium]|nr:TonB-dependent receptor [Vicinamibacterales bacterium]